MWIDADIGFNAMDIVSMLIADKDVVCGAYPKKKLTGRAWRGRSKPVSRRTS